MGECRWTEMQKLAIDTRDKTLLVSAAAGSGKTATLTERIIQSILDEKHPESISNMLIATFTNASVNDLRKKITARITKALKEDPTNERLQRELNCLPGAKILTIDSFCGDILRANCAKVGVPQGYRIADSCELEILGNMILDGIINEIYEDRLLEIATSDEIETLSECLTESRNQEELCTILTGIYNETVKIPEGVSILRRFCDTYKPENFTSVDNTVFGEEIVSRVKSTARHFVSVGEKYLRTLISVDDKKVIPRIEVLTRDIQLFKSLADSETYEEMHNVIDGQKWEDCPRGKWDAPIPYTKYRNQEKDFFLHLSNTLLKFGTEYWRHLFERTYPVLNLLVKILEFYDRTYREEKLKRGILSHTDILYYTYHCLWENGELTDVAYAQRELYSSIYVDEYQDVDSLQHLIFSAISKERNRFSVGDIKQSIYTFRGSNPDEFAKMKMSFPHLLSSGGSGDEANATIFMSENFRCDRGIVDFVNSIFDKIFMCMKDSIGYIENDRLVFSKIYDGEEPPYQKPLICILCDPKGKKIEDTIDESGEPTATDNSQPSIEARLVAKKIRELLDFGTLNNGQPIKEDDIAIIARNPKSVSRDFQSALENEGISSVVGNRSGFFKGPEVLLALAMLNSIDNPHKDIYLASFMCSPLCHFTPDDLVKIRMEGQSPTLFDSLKVYCKKHSDFEKGKIFLEKLNKYRIMSEGMTVDLLIGRLFRESGILALASKIGKKDNLLRLYEHSRRFENSSYKGLYNFINYINNIVEKNTEFDKGEIPDISGVVKIISTHSSKGLEFPVVFYVNTGKNFKNDTVSRVAFDSRFGMAIKTKTDNGLSLIENPILNTVYDFKVKKQLEEEMRILYVGLTRAREKLFVTATVSQSFMKDFDLERDLLLDTLSPVSVYFIKNALSAILCANNYSCTPPERFLSDASSLYGENPDSDKETSKATCEPKEEEKQETEISDNLYKTLIERFNFKYKNEHLTHLPEKLSVSKLYPEILNFEEETSSLEEIQKKRIELKFEKSGVLPAFHTGEEKDESAKRGIATHLFMQFADFENLKKNGATAELERLKSLKFISEKDSERVRLDEIELFRKSKLLEEMLSAKQIFREQRFNIRLPAKDFTTDSHQKELFKDEEILVQGVIDCLFVSQDGELHLIDYKTDRLTKSELENRILAEKKLRFAHEEQLSYYKEAIKKMFGKYPKTVEVYSLPLGDTVDVDKKM